MLHARGEHVGGDLVVVPREPIEIGRIDPRRRGEIAARIRRGIAGQADGRHAAVRYIVLVDVDVVQEHPGRAVQAEGQRGRDAGAVVLDLVAAGYAAVLLHQVQAHGDATVFVQDLVPVGGGAFLVPAAVGGRGIEEIAHLGLLGHQVDRAGGRAAAVVGAGRALEDFDLLDVEHVARDRAEVTHVIDEDRAGGIEATHVDGVAGIGAAVLAEIEGAHAGAVAQGLGQGSGALLVDQLLLDHGQRLRGIHQGLAVFGGGGLVSLVVRFLGGGDFDLGQRAAGGLGVRAHRGQQQGAGDGEVGSGQCRLARSLRVLTAFNVAHGKGPREGVDVLLAG